MVRQSRVGFAAMRLQPLHKGHCKTINQMTQECETVIIGLGSAQKSREEHDPWTVEERMEMLRNVYGDRIKIVPLNDLNASTPEEWTDYIFEKLNKLGMKEPTDYYTGSLADSTWYEHAFRPEDGPMYRWPSDINEPPEEITGVLHIIDRDMNPVPAATELRSFLQLRSSGWMNWVPSVNYELVDGAYPEEFKIPLK